MIIIVNGFPRSGKDSFMDFCLETLKFHSVGTGPFTGLKHSTIDTIKRTALSLGWDGKKTTESRCMLSEMKDLYTKYFDGPLKEIQELTKYVDVLFIGMREPKEIARTKAWCNNNGIPVITVLVSSIRGETDHSSHSDAMVLKYDYDKTIFNNDTLFELSAAADWFMMHVIDELILREMKK